jgi:hypothetical protein
VSCRCRSGRSWPPGAKDGLLTGSLFLGVSSRVIKCVAPRLVWLLVLSGAYGAAEAHAAFPPAGPGFGAPWGGIDIDDRRLAAIDF